MPKYKKVQPHNKDQIIYLYSNLGMSMGAIASLTGYSKTKVHVILHEANTPDNLIFLSHDLAAYLCNNGMDLKEYTDLVRAKNIATRYGIGLKIILAYVCEVTKLCFMWDVEPQKLVTSFSKFSEFVSSFPCKTSKDLVKNLVLDLKMLEIFSEQLDGMMDVCRRLRIQIDGLEKSAARSTNAKLN